MADDTGASPPLDPDATPLLVDAMLGKLATYLRMCGYDAAYVLDRGVEADDEVAALARDEGRVLLTRDRALAARVEGSVRLTERDVTDQLRELRAAGATLELPDEPRRCSACNGVLDPVPTDASTPAETPDPAETRVWRCRACGKMFWKGSHWDDVADRL